MKTETFFSIWGEYSSKHLPTVLHLFALFTEIHITTIATLAGAHSAACRCHCVQCARWMAFRLSSQMFYDSILNEDIISSVNIFSAFLLSPLHSLCRSLYLSLSVSALWRSFSILCSMSLSIYLCSLPAFLSLSLYLTFCRNPCLSVPFSPKQCTKLYGFRSARIVFDNMTQNFHGNADKFSLCRMAFYVYYFNAMYSVQFTMSFTSFNYAAHIRQSDKKWPEPGGWARGFSAFYLHRSKCAPARTRPTNSAPIQCHSKLRNKKTCNIAVRPMMRPDCRTIRRREWAMDGRMDSLLVLRF